MLVSLQGLLSAIGFFFITCPYDYNYTFMEKFQLCQLGCVFFFSSGKLVITQNITGILISLSRFGQSRILALCRYLAGRQSSCEVKALQFALDFLKFFVETQ